jgi:hypothetical protein
MALLTKNANIRAFFIPSLAICLHGPINRTGWLYVIVSLLFISSISYLLSFASSTIHGPFHLRILSTTVHLIIAHRALPTLNPLLPSV